MESLQNLLPFLAPLLRNSSEAHRNFSVIKSLRQSENLQIGTSVFAVYPNGETLVHFVCFKDSQGMKAVVSRTPHGRRR
ncbi:unnamed protein product [Brassica oleracea var. botrytis]|nr:unnamed protein product [Brassica napus]CDY53082.1 BnaC03g76720D [Brassica napus]VDC98876.1 unnamed protein product [Brassica oleracea]